MRNNVKKILFDVIDTALILGFVFWAYQGGYADGKHVVPTIRTSKEIQFLNSGGAYKPWEDAKHIQR